MLWAAGLAAALALLVGLGIGLFVSRPIRQLTGAAHEIAGGELGKTVHVRPTSAAEIKTLAETFNRMSSALAEAENARQRMAADIAHELRTPLSVMRGQLQAMLDGLHPGDSEHIGVVYDQTLHLNRLVDDLRLLTQAESGQLPLEKQAIRPEDLLAEAKALFEPLAQDAKIALTISCKENLPRIRVDPDRMRQVMGNLIANALRHTPAGGKIDLRAARGDRSITFTVANTGVTLTPEQADHVFDRFWRADEARSRDQGGAGLGLAITRQILQLHGGSIRVELGDGETLFIFDLPPANPPG
jgi:signal transduction histidine kinase